MNHAPMTNADLTDIIALAILEQTVMLNLVSLHIPGISWPYGFISTSLKLSAEPPKIPKIRVPLVKSRSVTLMLPTDALELLINTNQKLAHANTEK